jgi:Zn-dependent protease
MRPTFRLGRIAGVEVGFHWSLLAIGALLVGSLAGTMLPQAVPHAHGSYISAAVLAVVLFFGSILAHELAHSIVARRQGQTVNGITLWLLGGVSELGSEAKNANDELRVAIAGPATSITLGVVFGVIAIVADAVLPAGGLVPTVAWWLALVNVVLGFFNLLPGAPLDGGRVLAALHWKFRGNRRNAQVAAARSGRVLGMVLVAGSVFLLSTGTDALMPALVGFFVLSASRREESTARVLRTLDGHTVGELMRPLAGLPPEWTTVADFGPSAEPTLVAGWDGNPTALLPPGAVFAVPPEARTQVQLRTLAVPLSKFPRVRTEESATGVMEKGLPALVDDADGRPIGLFGLDELKVAAQGDPVLAKSAR